MFPNQDQQELNRGRGVVRVKIVGYLKTSLLDWPGEVSSVIWTAGCNFRCPFCHNRDLITGENLKLIDESELLEDLKKRGKWVDGLVITGGEPTLQTDLIDFCHKIKKLGLKIKLDTNGSNPEILGELIQRKLIDFVAWDFKIDWDDYDIVGAQSIAPIQKSMGLIINSGLDYEFRTTVVPRIHTEEVLRKMEEVLRQAQDKWVWQKFVGRNCWDKAWEEEKSYRKSEIMRLRRMISKNIILRGW